MLTNLIPSSFTACGPLEDEKVKRTVYNGITRNDAAVRTLTNALVAVLAALVSYEYVRLMMLNWTKKMNVSRIPTRFYIVTMIFSFAIVAVIYLVRTIESLQEAAGKED